MPTYILNQPSYPTRNLRISMEAYASLPKLQFPYDYFFIYFPYVTQFSKCTLWLKTYMQTHVTVERVTRILGRFGIKDKVFFAQDLLKG